MPASGPVAPSVPPSVPIGFAGEVHVSVTDAVSSAQLAPPSGTLAVTVTVTVPALAQVKVGDADVVLLNVPLPVPPETAHEKITSELLPLLSTPWAARLATPPTSNDEGLADSAETAAHPTASVTVPPTLTEPPFPASTLVAPQTRLTVALEVTAADTLKVADPAQLRPLDVVAVKAIV
jgi:hypothetical protein